MSHKYLEWFQLPRNRWIKDTPFERDSQKQKLYDAEGMTKWKINPQNLNPRFNSIEEIQRFVNKLTSSAWFKRRWGDRNIIVVELNRGYTAYARFSSIHLPRWAWNSTVVLHEVAHIATGHNRGPSHGRFFARTFLELVGHILGPEVRKILKEEYKKYRVKYVPNYQLTDEDRQARKERFINNVLNTTKC